MGLVAAGAGAGAALAGGTLETVAAFAAGALGAAGAEVGLEIADDPLDLPPL